tara:strand:- start:1831 stop:2220 length:390 start_codon:yes stop_codon:yes gene_type:complete
MHDRCTAGSGGGRDRNGSEWPVQQGEQQQTDATEGVVPECGTGRDSDSHMDDFLEHTTQEQKILAMGLAESRRAKQERTKDRPAIAKHRRAKRMRSHRLKRKGRRDRNNAVGKRESVTWTRDMMPGANW